MRLMNLEPIIQNEVTQKNTYHILMNIDNKLWNSERDGNTRPPDLPLVKPLCKSGSSS